MKDRTALTAIFFITLTLAFIVGIVTMQQNCAELGGVLVRGLFWLECVVVK